MLKVGQEFKNYREICKYLREEEKTGKSRELQLKRWQLSFSWHKEGNRFVIDDIKEKEIRRVHGGNHKHVDEFLPYVVCCLKYSGVSDEYLGTQRIMKSELKLIPSEMYEVYNHRSRDHNEYLLRNGISSVESLRKFVRSFEVLAMETLEGCLNTLERGGGIIWSPGQIFVIGQSHNKIVHGLTFGKLLDDVETAVCNEMNEDDELKGRQYLHVIKRSKELMEKFYSECLERLRGDKKLMRYISKEYKRKYKQEFVPEMLTKYYRVYYIERLNIYRIRKWQYDKSVSVIIKKAFVNPVGQELQMLKEKVYKDIFQRMGSNSKDTNNKVGIPDEDFENLKELVMSSGLDHSKLTKRDYSPPSSKKQGEISAVDELAEG